jgi:hypothetical protein
MFVPDDRFSQVADMSADGGWPGRVRLGAAQAPSQEIDPEWQRSDRIERRQQRLSPRYASGDFKEDADETDPRTYLVPNLSTGGLGSDLNQLLRQARQRPLGNRIGENF